MAAPLQVQWRADFAAKMAAVTPFITESAETL